MINKAIIIKSINEAIIKCSNPRTLTRKDKEFIASVNLDNFREDEQYDTFNEEMGKLERKQNDYQQKNIKLTGNEVEELIDYSQINYEFINDKLYNDPKFRKMIDNGIITEDDLATSIRILTRAINKSDGLLNSTILHRYGEWDEELHEGDVGVWEGFTSLTYQKKEATQFSGEDRRAIKIYAPKHTKGLVINEENGLSSHTEHEYLIGRKTRFYVLSTNKQEIEILLLPSND